jgi:hypothetical protein
MASACILDKIIDQSTPLSLKKEEISIQPIKMLETDSFKSKSVYLATTSFGISSNEKFMLKLRDDLYKKKAEDNKSN